MTRPGPTGQRGGPARAAGILGGLALALALWAPLAVSKAASGEWLAALAALYAAALCVSIGHAIGRGGDPPD
jgi:hypothetical protein